MLLSVLVETLLIHKCNANWKAHDCQRHARLSTPYRLQRPLNHISFICHFGGGGWGGTGCCTKVINSLFCCCCKKSNRAPSKAYNIAYSLLRGLFPPPLHLVFWQQQMEYRKRFRRPVRRQPMAGTIPLLGMSCSIMTMHKCDEPLWLPETCMMESWGSQFFYFFYF